MHKKTLRILISFFLVTTSLFSQIPEGYYSNATGLQGDALKVALHDIIKVQTGKTYGDSRYILDETDRDTNNSSNVLLVYLGTSVSGVWDAGATWNREHVWPQSLFGESASNSVVNIASDLHNLKPSDTDENAFRGNKYYDIVASTSAYLPRDEVKGDLARILFYMTVRYDNLELINSAPSSFQMAKLDVLLQWHLDDPVDNFEINRNNVIYSYQNNRNPFIDHPEYVDAIWNPTDPEDTTGTTNISSIKKASVTLYPNPANSYIHILSDECFDNFILYNVIGNKVKEASYNKNIFVGDLPKGQYILVLSNQKNNIVLPLVIIN